MMLFTFTTILHICPFKNILFVVFRNKRLYNSIKEFINGVLLFVYILKNIDRTDKAITYVPIGMISKIEKLSETVDIKLPHEMMDEIDKFL